MGRVFRPTFWKRVKGGVRRRVQTTAWYAEWQVAGRTRRKKIGTRQAANSALARLEEAESRRRHGLPDPVADAHARTRPLVELLGAYIEVLAARDTSAEYRANTDAQITRVLTECCWHTWTDIDADSFTRFLGRLRDTPRPRKITGAARKPGGPTHFQNRPVRGCGPATLNSYLRTVKAFTRWLADRLGQATPLRKLKPYPEDVDRRRSTRILTDAELSRLLLTTAATPRKFASAVWGADRAMLYRLAAFTGLRAGELAELTACHFDLVGQPPTVTVAARDAKGKRAEPIPLPAHLAEQLTHWLADRDPRARLFPGDWAKHKRESHWFAGDLRRAGVPARDEQNRPITFHSLKRRFVVRLINAGAKVHEVRRMARHIDVATTLKHYVDENLTDLGKLADRLPRV